MRIWWCQEHEAGIRTGALDRCPVTLVFRVDTSAPCRMVPMRLIADDALVDREALAEALAEIRGLRTRSDWDLIEAAARLALSEPS